MPRDANGNYTLPSGNPVVSGTTIESAWANTTMDDLRQAMTDSLDRFGRGGMQAPFRFVDGTVSAPGMSWASEISTGFYRAGGNDMRATVAGINRMRWSSAGVDVWDPATSSWFALVKPDYSNFALLNAANVFTQPQAVRGAATAWQITKPGTPDLGARFAFNVGIADGIDISRFNGTDWIPRIQVGGNANNYYNADAHYFASQSGATAMAEFTETYIKFNRRNFWIGGQFAPTEASTVSAGAVVEVPGNVQLGVFASGGFAGPRAALFAFDNGVNEGTVGLDWTFSNGVAAFQFRRAGVPIFNYNAEGVAIINGTAFDVYAPNNATFCRLRVDSNGPAYWNAFGGATSYQWYLASGLLATMQADSMAFGGVAADYRISGPTAGGAIQFRNDPSTTNRGLSLGSIDNGGTFFAAFQIGDFVPGVARFLNGLILQVFNPANNWSGGFNVPIGNNASAVQYVENGVQRGAMLWHHDQTYRYGGIFVSTSAAPGTGGTPGQIWLQV